MRGKSGSLSCARFTAHVHHESPVTVRSAPPSRAVQISSPGFFPAHESASTSKVRCGAVTVRASPVLGALNNTFDPMDTAVRLMVIRRRAKSTSFGLSATASPHLRPVVPSRSARSAFSLQHETKRSSCCGVR